MTPLAGIGEFTDAVGQFFADLGRVNLLASSLGDPEVAAALGL